MREHGVLRGCANGGERRALYRLSHSPATPYCTQCRDRGKECRTKRKTKPQTEESPAVARHGMKRRGTVGLADMTGRCAV